LPPVGPIEMWFLVEWLARAAGAKTIVAATTSSI
jgi:hypothetical protein